MLARPQELSGAVPSPAIAEMKLGSRAMAYERVLSYFSIR